MRDIRKLLESDDFNQSKIGLVHYMDAKGEERPMSCGIFVKYFPNVLSILEPAILRPPPTSPSRTGNAHVLLSKDGFT